MVNLVISLLIFILIFVGMYKTFSKMGHDDAWMLIIPILNIVFNLKFLNKPLWMILLFIIVPIIPILCLYFGWLVSEKVAAAYGKSTGFAVGLLLLGFIFYPILGFGAGQPTKTA